MKKIMSVLVCLILVMALTACANYQYSDELRAELMNTIVPQAKSWIEENIEGAEDITGEITGPMIYEIYSDIVRGNFTLDGNTYGYLMNVETGECLTTENEDAFFSYSREVVRTELEKVIDVEELYIFVSWEEIPATIVSDFNFGKKRPKVQYYPATASEDGMVHRYTEDELREKAKENAEKEHVYINMYVPEVRRVPEVFQDLEFLRRHPNWEIRIMERDVEDYYVLMKDDTYSLIHYFRDQKGEMIYETVADSTR